MKIPIYRIPVTRLDHNKEVMKHYESLSAAIRDSRIHSRAIREHLKDFTMDRNRNYWILKTKL